MSLRPDWLPALAAFEAAARHQNFARAAEELHLTASAVSHHVRRLETRLDVVLFQRHARGVALTAEGRKLADASSTAFTDVEAVLQSLRGSRDDRDRVRVTTLHSFAHAWLIPRLAQFVALYPHISLRVETEIALTRLDEGGPDLGIRHGPGYWPGISAYLLIGDSLFPVTSPQVHARIAARTAADIARLPLIADLSRQGWHDWFRAAGCGGLSLDERYTFSDSTDALAAAAAGMGATLARERIARPWLDAGRVVALPGPVIEARWSYYAIHPAHRRLRPAAKLFLDWLMEQARSVPGANGSHALPARDD